MIYNPYDKADEMLKSVKKSSADRERQERWHKEQVRVNREIEEQAELERQEQSNSLMNKYIEKAKAREQNDLQSWEQSRQNIHDTAEKKRIAEEREHLEKSWERSLQRGKDLIERSKKL